MKWWVKALLASLLWILLVHGIGALHSGGDLQASMTEAQVERMHGRYTDFSCIGLLFIWLFADCTRRWNPRKTGLTEERLMKRGRAVRRNLRLLAILCALECVLLYQGSTAARPGGGPPIVPPGFVPAFGLLAIGLWVLSVAAGRGEPGAAGTVVVCELVFLGLAVLVAGGIALLSPPSSLAGEKAGFTSGVLIHLGIYLGFMKSRAVLSELQSRELTEHVFPDAVPGEGLCIAGGVSLVLGFLCLLVVPLAAAPSHQPAPRAPSHQPAAQASFQPETRTAYHAAPEAAAPVEEAPEATGFEAILEDHDKELIASFKAFGNASPRIACGRVVMNIDRTEQKLADAWDEAKGDAEMQAVLTRYGNALKTLRAGIEEFRTPGGDRTEANRLIEDGNRLRTEALQAFRELCQRRAKT